MTRAIMRILVHLNSLELGGTQINAVDFAVAARAHGIESILLGARDTLPPGPSLLDFAEDRGIDIEIYDADDSILGRGRQLAEFARNHRVDLVHVYGSWGGGARPTYWGFSKFGRRPWLQTVYEMEVSPKIKRHMPLIVGTGYLVDELRGRPAPTILISPPVDTDANHPDHATGEDFRHEHRLSGPLLVSVSRLDASMKSVPARIAIDAMRYLADDATLVIVGTGDDVRRIRESADRVNDEVGREAVRLVGPMADPRPAYAAADIMLGMGGSAARALAFGKPLVVQGEAGWSQLFEQSTAESLARNSYWSPDEVDRPVDRIVAIIAPLLTDAQRRTELGAFGRAFAVERFGLTAMASRLAVFYQEALSAYGLRNWSADLPPELGIFARKVGRRAGLPLRDGEK